MRRCGLDHTVFSMKTEAGCVILVVYVDDIVITGSDGDGIVLLKEFLKKKFCTG